jgi:hypothetical protein
MRGVAEEAGHAGEAGPAALPYGPVGVSVHGTGQTTRQTRGSPAPRQARTLRSHPRSGASRRTRSEPGPGVVSASAW